MTTDERPAPGTTAPVDPVGRRGSRTGWLMTGTGAVGRLASFRLTTD